VADFLQWQTTVGSQSREIRGAVDALVENQTTMHRALNEVISSHTALRQEIGELQRAVSILQSRPDNFHRLYRHDRDELNKNLLALRREMTEHAQRMGLSLQQVCQNEAEDGVQLYRKTVEIAASLEGLNANLQRLEHATQETLSTTQEALNNSHSVLTRIESMPIEGKYAYLGQNIAIATTINGHRLFIDTRDRQLAPHLATRGLWEPWNDRIFKVLLREGDTVVDVGSNVGYFALLAGSLVGASGQVFAFEANPPVCALLNASVEINGFADRIETRSVAVSDRAGTATFATYENHQGDGHIVADNLVHDHANARTIEVPTDTLDAMIGSPHRNIRLLHLDVEGSEPAVLRGTRSLIERSRNLVILMEWGLNTQDKLTELKWLSSIGFSFARIEHNLEFRNITIDQLGRFKLCDVICFREDIPELSLKAHEHAVALSV
jgi:FkbM family methyltransferase